MVMFKYVFRYNNQIVYETAESNEIDGFVDEWLEDNFSVLNEYSGYVLDKDNYDDYATNFKSEYIQEVE
jgi:hypothetical protein